MSRYLRIKKDPQDRRCVQKGVKRFTVCMPYYRCISCDVVNRSTCRKLKRGCERRLCPRNDYKLGAACVWQTLASQVVGMFAAG